MSRTRGRARATAGSYRVRTPLVLVLSWFRRGERESRMTPRNFKRQINPSCPHVPHRNAERRQPSKVLKMYKTEWWWGGGVGLTGDTYVFCQRWVLSRPTRLPGVLVPQTLVSGRTQHHDQQQHRRRQRRQCCAGLTFSLHRKLDLMPRPQRTGSPTSHLSHLLFRSVTSSFSHFISLSLSQGPYSRRAGVTTVRSSFGYPNSSYYNI